jgi:hypothetical protein
MKKLVKTKVRAGHYSVFANGKTYMVNKAKGCWLVSQGNNNGSNEKTLKACITWIENDTVEPVAVEPVAVDEIPKIFKQNENIKMKNVKLSNIKEGVEPVESSEVLCLTFAGYYNGYGDGEIDNMVDDEVNHLNASGIGENSVNNLPNCIDYEKFFIDYSVSYLEFINNAISKSMADSEIETIKDCLVFKELKRPSQYNRTTDKIDCLIKPSDVLKMVQFVDSIDDCKEFFIKNNGDYIDEVELLIGTMIHYYCDVIINIGYEEFELSHFMDTEFSIYEYFIDSEIAKYPELNKFYN